MNPSLGSGQAPRIEWRDDSEGLGRWADDCPATALVGHDYGGTHARTGVYLRQTDGSWRRARIGAIRHEGRRELMDAGIADALDWIRRHVGDDARVRLGIGCKGPTDTPTGWTNPGTHFSWGAHNAVEYYAARHPGAFQEIIAANDLLTGALGAVLDADVQRQLRRAVEAWNAARPDRPISAENLRRDVVVVSLGTGAGYKVIHRDGSVGEGGEVWTPYAPIDPGLFNWLWERYRQEAATRGGHPERYAPYNERFVSGSGLPLYLEYLESALGEKAEEPVRCALDGASDRARAISEQAHAGCPVCRKAFLYLAVHLASLCQQIVQSHKPRSLVLSGASLVAPNWDLIEEPFLRYFHRDFGDMPVEFPLVRASVIGLREWMAQTALAVDRSPHPGVDGAAYLAAHAELYKQA